MGFRVDQAGLDAVGLGSTAGGGRFHQTSESDPPWQPRPFSTKEEYAISNALRLMALPVDEIRNIRPPMINDPFPPQFGYDTTPLTIEEVLGTGRWAPVIRSWVSGAPAVRRSTAEDQMWSGSARNVTDPSMNPMN